MTTLDQLLPRSVRDALDDIVRRRATVKLQLDVKDGVVRGASSRESLDIAKNDALGRPERDRTAR